MKWHFNKRLVTHQSQWLAILQHEEKNMFLFQRNWIKDIVVNINRIGRTKKMFVPYHRQRVRGDGRHIVVRIEYRKELSGLCTGLQGIS